MTELRKRMIECLQRRGLAARTQEMYVRAVHQLAEHYRTSPDMITEEELRQYFLYLKHVKRYSRSASTIALCGIKFFFPHTLNRNWTTLTCVRLPRYRVCLTPRDSCGLRLQEGTHLQVPDIDSARMLIHVRHGKGGKDRDCPLATTHAGTAAPLLGHASPSRADLPGAGSWAHPHGAGHNAHAQKPCAGRVQACSQAERAPPTGRCPYATPLRGDPSA